METGITDYAGYRDSEDYYKPGKIAERLDELEQTYKTELAFDIKEYRADLLEVVTK